MQKRLLFTRRIFQPNTLKVRMECLLFQMLAFKNVFSTFAQPRLTARARPAARTSACLFVALVTGLAVGLLVRRQNFKAVNVEIVANFDADCVRVPEQIKCTVRLQTNIDHILVTF